MFAIITPMRYNGRVLKAVLKEKKISMYKLAKDSGVPYSTINDLVNRRLPIENLRSGQLRSLAKCLKVSMDDLYDICDDRIFVESTTHGITGEVVVKKRVYYVVFDKGGKHYEGEILPVKTQVTKYIKDVAKWKLDEMLDKIAIEKV